MSSGETEYTPAENAGKWDEQWWRTLWAADTCSTKLLARLNEAFVPFTSWKTILLSDGFLWENNCTLCTFLFLTDFYILLCISRPVFNQHHSKEWPCLCGWEESSVFEVVNCCWTVSHVSGMWLMMQHQTQREAALWTLHTPCSWLFSCQRNSCGLCIVYCPTPIVLAMAPF